MKNFKLSPNCFLQGGYLRSIEAIGGSLLIAQLADGISSDHLQTALVINPHPSHLCISYKKEMTSKQGEHYILYSTTLLEKDKKGITHAILKDCGMKINAALEELMIKGAKEQLNLLTPNACAKDFLLLVPFLYKKKIRKLFIEKLLSTNNEDVIEKVNRYIVECFDRRLKDLKHIDGLFKEYRRASHLKEWALLKIHCNKIVTATPFFKGGALSLMLIVLLV